MTDLLSFHPNPEHDPDGSKLRGLLNLAVEAEKLTDRRRFLTALVALLAVPVWIVAVWPRLLPGGDQRYVLALFGGVLVLALIALVQEWLAHRALDRHIGENPSLVDRPGEVEDASPEDDGE